MSKTLAQIAEQLRDTDKKVQLLYAFNGTGKTRLSRELKHLIAPKNDDADGAEPDPKKFLYYNAFTEDLFYWDNDLSGDVNLKLKIQSNSFTDWLIKLLKDLGQDQNIITNFQRYTSDKITPNFNEEYKYKTKNNIGTEIEITVPAFSEVNFTMLETLQVTHNGDNVTYNGDNVTISNRYENVKISKGEESNFIWSIFYTLLDQIITILNVAEFADRETDQFNDLEYVFIDDPVSSLDENHLIQLAVNLAALIKSSTSDLRFIITTHNPLFYNVLCNELQNDDKNLGYKSKIFEKYRLEKRDSSFELEKQANDSPFSYHLYLMSEVKAAISNGQLKKYHFSFLRHILEKTSTFLGYKRWEHLLPVTNEGTSDVYAARILNISSHSKHSGEEVSDLTDDDKRVLNYLVEYIIEEYGYWKPKEENNG